MSYLDRRLNRPVIVHTRYADGRDEHGNVVYAEDSYTSRCYCQIQARMESADGRSSDDMYLVLLPAVDVLAHKPPADPTEEATLDAFSWLEVDEVGRLEVDGDPAFWRNLSSNGRSVHHVEVMGRRSSTL